MCAMCTLYICGNAQPIRNASDASETPPPSLPRLLRGGQATASPLGRLRHDHDSFTQAQASYPKGPRSGSFSIKGSGQPVTRLEPDDPSRFPILFPLPPTVVIPLHRVFFSPNPASCSVLPQRLAHIPLEGRLEPCRKTIKRKPSPFLILHSTAIMAPKRIRCNAKECREPAQRIIGDCGFCSGHFCGKHRLLEDHKCTGLEDVSSTPTQHDHELFG